MKLRALIPLYCASQILTGCFYLHSTTHQKAAEDARSSFDAVVRNSAVSAVVADYVAQTELRSTVTRDLDRLDRMVMLDAILAQPWEDLVNDTRDELTEAKSALVDAKAKNGTLQTQLVTDLAKLANFKGQVKDSLEALNAASEAVARYAATQNLVREAMLGATDATRPKSFDALRDILAKKHTFTTYTLENGTLKSADKQLTVADLLGIPIDLIPKTTPKSIEDVEPVIAKLSVLPQLPQTLLARLTFQNPGIATTILGLAFDVARAEEQRISVAVDMAKRELKIRGAQSEFLTRHVSNLEQDLDADQGLGIAAAASAEQDNKERVRSTLDRLALEYQRADREFLRTAAADQFTSERALKERDRARGVLHSVHVGLASNFRRRVVDAKERAIFEERLSALETERDLRDAAARFGEREAVIGRGLEGLVAFHAGGITSEDLGRILGIAQTIGIFIIAGGQ